MKSLPGSEVCCLRKNLLGDWLGDEISNQVYQKYHELTEDRLGEILGSTQTV